MIPAPRVGLKPTDPRSRVSCSSYWASQVPQNIFKLSESLDISFMKEEAFILSLFFIPIYCIILPLFTHYFIRTA